MLLAAALAAGTFLFVYWPTLGKLVAAWDGEADYSHGYLVAPMALLMLWMRRDTFPGGSRTPAWGGLVLLVAALAVRWLGQRLFLEALAGWSMVIWIAAVCWLLAGRKIFTWALPSIGFLLFMVPLPYRFEELLSWQLQRVSTLISCWILQFVGQPAVAEGNTIFLNSHQLEVEQACSGLRMLIGVTALAVALAMLVRRSWWEKLVLLVAIVPVALLANALRVTATGFMMQYAPDETAQRFSHDFAGWMVIPLAAAFLAMTLWFMRRLVVEVYRVEGPELLQDESRAPA